MVVKSEKDDDILIKLTDFGFACMSKDMDLCLGTPHYMAPEIAAFQHYDTQVDVWSTGVLTYQIMTNKVPFNLVDNDMQELRRQILKDPPAFPYKDFVNISVQA